MMVFILILLILCSAFFSGSETALSRVTKRQAEKNETLINVLSKPDTMISTILISNNVVNMALSSIATLTIGAIFGESYIALGIAILTLILIIFGEITPKTLAYSNAKKVSILISPIIAFLMVIFKPINFLIDKYIRLIKKWFKIKETPPKLTFGEFREIIKEGEVSGIFDPEDRNILEGFLAWKHKFVTEIYYVKKQDMVYVNASDSYNTILTKIKNTGYSRLPVIKNNNVIGILHDADLLYANPADFDVTKIMRKIIFVTNQMTVEECTDKMRLSRNHMAIIVDSHSGDVLGLTTLEICTELIIGQIYDETDKIPPSGYK